MKIFFEFIFWIWLIIVLMNKNWMKWVMNRYFYIILEFDLIWEINFTGSYYWDNSYFTVSWFVCLFFRLLASVFALESWNCIRILKYPGFFSFRRQTNTRAFRDLFPINSSKNWPNWVKKITWWGLEFIEGRLSQIVFLCDMNDLYIFLKNNWLRVTFVRLVPMMANSMPSISENAVSSSMEEENESIEAHIKFSNET